MNERRNPETERAPNRVWTRVYRDRRRAYPGAAGVNISETNGQTSLIQRIDRPLNNKQSNQVNQENVRIDKRSLTSKR